jgi:DNA mismatch endonuclease (patch repair protein)
MANVALKGGKGEKALARALWQRGIRYRKNYKMLPGSPDIAITKSKIAVFIDGEFWHGFDWANRREKLKNNREYWIVKIEENINRDNNVNLRLEDMGWTVIRFWEKEVLNNLEYCIDLLIKLTETSNKI